MKAKVSGNKVTVMRVGAEDMLTEFAIIVDITKAECAVAADRLREFDIIGVDKLPEINLMMKKCMHEGRASSRYSCGLFETFRCGELDALIGAADDSVRSHELIAAASSGNLWAVGELFAASENPFDLSEAFRFAAKTGQLQVVEFLYSLGYVDLDGVDSVDGNSALNSAATGGHLEVVKRLTEFGANINLKDFRGFSPLHSAVLTKKASVIEYLCSVGAEMNSVENKVSV